MLIQPRAVWRWFNFETEELVGQIMISLVVQVSEIHFLGICKICTINVLEYF